MALLAACSDDNGNGDLDPFDGGGDDATAMTGDGGATAGDAGDDGGTPTDDGGFDGGATNGGAIDGGSTGDGAAADAAMGDAGTDGGDATVDPMLESIDVTPTDPTAAAGTTVQLTATGTYSDDTTADVTAEVTWSSDAESVATVSNETDSEGEAQAVAPGEARLTASLGDVSGSTTLTVTDAELESITVMPAEPSVALGTTVQLSAMGMFSDGSSQELTEQVTWSSSNEEVATVGDETDGEGLVVARSTGTTTLTASLGDVSGETTFTVTDAELVAINLEPTAPTLAPGTQVMLSAIGTYTDASKQDVTQQATWTTADEAVAAVSDQEGEKGMVAGEGPGQTSVTASIGEVDGATTVTVTEALLASINIEPQAKSTVEGTTLQYSAFGTFDDDTVQDLTAQVTWDSSDEEVATVSNASGTRGLATSVSMGTTTITAAFGGETASAMLAVTDASLETIEVTPASASIADGTSQRFTATGTFSNDTSQDLTTQVTWTSTNTDVATIGEDGVAMGQSPGESTITASFGGQSGQASLEVTDAELESMVITPLTPSAAAGTPLAFTATGTFSDETEQDLTDQVTWGSDDPTVATIRNGELDPGLATAVAAGSATITATLDQVSVGTTLTVTDAMLESITVTPEETTIGDGSTFQFLATGSFSDGSQQDLTAAVAWSAAPGAVASISNVPGTKGLATGQEAGTAIITATLDDVAADAALTVTSATLDTIRIAPIDPTVATGTVLQLAAVGVFSDLSEQDLTDDVVWASDDTSVATVSNALLTRGRIAGLMEGSATITATLGDAEGSAELEVVDRTLESIVVAPEDTTLEEGSDRQFVATGVFSDGSEQDLTTEVVWDTDPAGVAFIRNLFDSGGLATGITPGETTVSATYEDIVGTTTLTVEEDVGGGL